jgi:PAS domain S-box-containing protein
MKDEDKTKGQLVDEIAEMRRYIADLKKSEVEHKLAESHQHLAAEIMGILNDPSTLTTAINSILKAIKRETGFEAIGIRLRSGDDFPYFVQEGFSNDFLLKENSLTVRTKDGKLCRDENGSYSLECTCGLVISGKTDPTNPLFTPGGSFWTNDSSPLLDLPVDQEPRLHPRNRCIHEGFLSLALIPIRADHEIVGLLQLTDRKKDCFTIDMIHFFEGISASIGIALKRKHLQKEINRSEEQHRLLIESLPLAVFVNIQGIIAYVNPAFLTLFKASSLDEVIGKRLIEFVPPELFDTVEKRRRIMTEQKRSVRPLELTLRCTDGTFITVVSTPISIVFQEQPAVLSVLYDITERKRNEIELQKAYKLLQIQNKEIEDLHAQLKAQVIHS